MKTKLIIIEGLPGSGKSTIAQLVHDILTEFGEETQVILEGNLDHPADYDGVANYKKDEFNILLSENEKFKGLINDRVIKQGNDYFIPYRKMKKEYGAAFPDELLNTIFKKDIYELPLDQNSELIIDKWKKFNEDALHHDTTYIFECNFIQNPVTIGMVKNNSSKETVINYVLQLEDIVKGLNPLLIYIDQKDLKFVFNKAIRERSKEWSEGFIEYYTNQGYGKANNFHGIEGTIQVLEARKKFEMEIFKMLKIEKKKIDNSLFNLNKCKVELRNILKEYF